MGKLAVFITMVATFWCLFQLHSCFVYRDTNGFVLAKNSLWKLSPVTVGYGCYLLTLKECVSPLPSLFVADNETMKFPLNDA